MINPLVLIVTPFVFGGLLVFLKEGPRDKVVIVASFFILALTSFYIFNFDFFRDYQYPVGEWYPPLGIRLVVDGFSLGFSSVSTLVFIAATFYALAFFKVEVVKTRYFWPVWFFLLASLNALFFSYDIFNMYVTLELVTFCSVILISLRGDEKSLKYSLQYFIYALLGSLFYLMGVALIYVQVGSLDLALISSSLERNFLSYLPFIFMITGLLIKGALFPFHFWLAGAHSSAYPPVSALLSAVVVKTSFFMAVKIYFVAFSEFIPFNFLYFLGLLACLAVFWGSVKAVISSRLKLIVAYSTVAQIGYLYLIFPYFTFTADSYFYGPVIHFVAHAFAKSSLFLAVGNIIYAVGSDELNKIKEVRNHLRMSLMAIGLSGITLMGLPISGGFIAKWFFIEAAIVSPQWWWALVPLVGGLLSFIYIFNILNMAMARSTLTSPPNLKLPPILLQIIPLVLALFSIFVGLSSNFLIDLFMSDFFLFVKDGGGSD